MDAGGVERGAYDIATALQKSEGESFLACEPGGRYIPKLKEAGVTVLEGPIASKNPLQIWENRRQLCEWIRYYNIDVIHVRSRAPAWSVWWSALKTQCPWVTTYHGVYTSDYAAKRLYNSVMVRANRVIVPSTWVERHIHQVYPWVTRSKISLIFRGVDTENFTPRSRGNHQDLRFGYGWKAEDIVLLCVGRMTRLKGLAFLLSVLRHLPNSVKLLWVGSVPPTHEYMLKESMAEFQGRFRWHDHTSDIQQFYAMCDAVVSPSLRPESFGRTIAEAGAMGRCVFASDHGGAQDIILPGKTGWLLPVADEQSWIEAINTFVSLPQDQYAHMERQALDFIRKNFDQSLFIQRTFEVYQGLV